MDSDRTRRTPKDARLSFEKSPSCQREKRGILLFSLSKAIFSLFSRREDSLGNAIDDLDQAGKHSQSPVLISTTESVEKCQLTDMNWLVSMISHLIGPLMCMTHRKFLLRFVDGVS